MSTVLFLGAGASKAFEYPTTTEFLDITQQSIKDSQPLTQVLEFFRNRAGESTPDIEKVIWELTDLHNTVEAIDKRGTFKQWIFYDTRVLADPNNLRRYSGDIKKLTGRINELVYQTYWKQNFDISNKVYRKLFSLLVGALDIFTTNYDLCVEHAFWDDQQLRARFYDGFHFDGVDVIWNPQNYGSFDNRLYKLHGSLNWRNGEGGRILRVNRRDKWDPEAQVMLYPGFKGEPEEPHYKFLHQQLAEKLTQSDYCIAIGSSFRDDLINKIFKNAFAANKKLRLLIWNTTEIKTDFPKDRIRHFPKAFGEDTLQTGLASLFP